ncbi:hypothetical protein ACN261_30015 [Micromonospora sp. WMMD723]|jgi:acyl dehydratase|uniref:hypothetical protein n=1 Tax=unclassified Micromonospora TaxID=2617518 RepID=UPI003B9586CD
MRVFASIEELAEATGEAPGPGPWFRIDQQRVDRFADATDDRQWIDLDPRRAATGPFGGTIAPAHDLIDQHKAESLPVQRRTTEY